MAYIRLIRCATISWNVKIYLATMSLRYILELVSISEANSGGAKTPNCHILSGEKGEKSKSVNHAKGGKYLIIPGVNGSTFVRRGPTYGASLTGQPKISEKLNLKT